MWEEMRKALDKVFLVEDGYCGWGDAMVVVMMMEQEDEMIAIENDEGCIPLEDAMKTLIKLNPDVVDVTYVSEETRRRVREKGFKILNRNEN